MKVLFISSWYPNKLEPTNGNFVQRHAEAVALQHHVEILHAIGDQYQKEKFLFDEKVINGLKTLTVYYRNTKNPLINFRRRMKAYKLGFQQMQKPDIVHANVMHNNMLFAVYLKKKYQIPFVITEHWTALQKDNSSKTSTIIKKIAKYIAHHAEYILPVSNNLKDSLLFLGIKTPMNVISNVVDTNIFEIRNRGIKGKTIKFLHVSSLIPRKKPQDIIEVIHRLHKNNYDVTLEIGGDGETTSLRNYATSLEAENYITIFDAISYSEVAKKMQNSDYFILFSENETQGCVILESYACGKPVISTKVGGATEFIIDGFGIGIEKNNTEQLYQTLEKLCKNEHNFKHESEIRSYIVSNYSQEAIAQKFTKIYSSLK